MIAIRHLQSGRVLVEVDSPSLAGANLAGEYLIHADLRETDLRSATLVYCNLSLADLSHSDLQGANLKGANLTEADLSGANLHGVNLAGVTLSLTALRGCVNLHHAEGLHQVVHAGPCILDAETLRHSAAYLGDRFLRGAGFTRAEIADLRRRYPGAE